MTTASIDFSLIFTICTLTLFSISLFLYSRVVNNHQKNSVSVERKDDGASKKKKSRSNSPVAHVVNDDEKKNEDLLLGKEPFSHRETSLNREKQHWQQANCFEISSF